MHPLEGRIHILSPDVAQKIAAGEVVDRPAALVRELMDNAIDAGATQVEVAVEGGGSRRVEVIDDGSGMYKEDLAICPLPHATSKISTVEDLCTTETLGFRGEALAAISAVARLEILTSRDGREAWRLVAGPGVSGQAEPRLNPVARVKGTSVKVLDLFDTIPARKKFLKRDGAEASTCRLAFLEKALAYPHLSFRFINQGKLDLMLPAVSTLKDRFAAALLEEGQGTFLHELYATGPDFSAVIVVGGPELHKKDRRMQYVFANGRRVQDFGLIQALEYGTQGWFPNGTHPMGAIFIDIDPSQADFNIHPAKREVRFRDPGAIHHAVSSTLRTFMHHLGRSVFQETKDSPMQLQRSFPDSYRTEQSQTGYKAMETLLEKAPSFAPRPEPEKQNQEANTIRYIGRVFDLFILVEKEDRLYLIDQHAAHERILYDRFKKKPIPRQELLVPLPFRTEGAEEDSFLEKNRTELEKLGILLERDEDDSWRIAALPELWHGNDGETVQAILELSRAGAHFAEKWLASLSCKGAIKEGSYLDPSTALTLAEETLSLPEPRCPHGRPLWTEIEKKDVLKAVRRIEG